MVSEPPYAVGACVGDENVGWESVRYEVHADTRARSPEKLQHELQIFRAVGVELH